MSDAGSPRPSAARSLADRVVVITGGGQGIGRAYAREIAADGGIAVIADVNETTGRSVEQEILAAGGEAVFHPLDVSDAGSCQALGRFVSQRYGRVDGLVNNAAVFSTITMRPFWEIPVEEWDRLMAINLRGPWLLTTALLNSLRASPAASIVNISSDAVWLGRGGYLHYVASKGGVAALSFAMSHELGADGIRVNTVAPGPTYTEVERATVSPAQKTAMLERQSLHREAHPEDMVGAVLFLLSDASGFITGQTLHVNGGMLHA
ncbi:MULTISPECIES: SDR family NAD(P)-dependent oxidoreductase [unclassified Microbacterium]|uniref:SDR family NAD(P)-dependent oxidoreductase n=1 Tax=unclassified Microbacterium TaxID=2609290 RepID=UPI00095AFF96|nr:MULTISPECIES: SDR family oxidoreductase [unclassified Microbacterium]OJV93324.1 MAG: 2-hydroxycyclohexanecarboxyl-CoA dehydrogenase [Microbacterium sp. 67-17]